PGDPSSLPLSATRISPLIPARSRKAFALATQVPMVSASLRQGMRIVSSSSPVRERTAVVAPSASVLALTVTDTPFLPPDRCSSEVLLEHLPAGMPIGPVSYSFRRGLGRPLPRGLCKPCRGVA